MFFLHPGKIHALNGRRDTTPWIPTFCLAVHWGKCSSIFVAVVFLCHHYFVLSSKFSRKTRHLQLNLRGVSRFWRPIFYYPNLSSHPCFSPRYCCWWWLLKITEIGQILIIDSWVSSNEFLLWSFHWIGQCLKSEKTKYQTPNVSQSFLLLFQFEKKKRTAWSNPMKRTLIS